MDPALASLLGRLRHLPDSFHDLKEGVEKAIDITDRDPEMALTRTRKVLERVIREVYERRYREPPGTRPLENLQQRLARDGHLPPVLDAYANTVRLLGNVGTHRFDQQVTTADVCQSLGQLLPILDWYSAEERTGPPADGRARPASGSWPPTRLAVVPKGLRSFDATDAGFFLDLLPGPRDTDGLPESVRFWKHRIEGRDELTFTVGVLYGPSGCGKSSLVKAGLLPRLGERVLVVYVEATAADTEARLLCGLRKACAELPGDLDLAGALAALRQGRGLRPGQKVLLLLDQFEQWLHGRSGEEQGALARALRQCDGERLQCVVLVRDDFWLAVSRFMQELQIELLQGQNLALVDLFDLPHARGVLAAFGRAFGRLPEALTREQGSFLDQAVEGLSQEGRVISVRLALFAEMVKGKPWVPATLKEVGGTEGIGVAFLEETFSSPLASPRHRLHQEAARSVLGALLPEQGTDIKGNMQSRGKLLAASGYGRRPRDFEELLRILDGEVRLITPTEPATTEEDSPAGGERYYQLTHDYLVPSLREWLTRKQKETRRGRAELLLADRAAVWGARPESRQLPSLPQWLRIRLLTAKKTWTRPQRKMMRKATRYHVGRGLAAVVLLAVISWGSYEGHGRLKAHALRDRLLNANVADVPGIVADMRPYRRWLDPLLHEANDEAAANQKARKELLTGLALLPVDPGQVDYLYGRLLAARPEEVAVLRDALAPHKDELVPKLWAVLEQPERGKEKQPLRAAAALALYDPDSPRWVKVRDQVADDLVAVPAVYLATWMEALRPVRRQLLPPLEMAFSDAPRRETERSQAAEVLADYAADQPEVLARLLLDADEGQFAALFPKIRAAGPRGLAVLQTVADRKPAPDAKQGARERLARQQANAAVALLRLGRPEKVWPLLRHSPDPRARSYLIQRLGLLGADVQALARRLDEEPDVTVRRALILTLAQFGDEEWPPAQRGVLVEKVQDLYRTADDPGLHAAAEWLLWRRKQDDWLRRTNDGWAKDAERANRLEDIRRELTEGKAKARPRWYVNGQGQTLVVLPAPGEFLMGSPPLEAGRAAGGEGTDEELHRQPLRRAFAIAAKDVTVEQFLRWRKDYEYPRGFAPTVDCPITTVTWYEAAGYCNWLSKQEKIPEAQWCYKPNPEGKWSEGMSVVPNYLRREGYRLPTEAEWEYACRAGASTSRYYGETEPLLRYYAWYTKNAHDQSLLPAGQMLPNDLGLFDMLGNAWQWCQDPYDTGGGRIKKGTDGELREDDPITDKRRRVIRGGSFESQAPLVRSAYRSMYAPTDRFRNVGFRLARTITAE
jgi:formylglycine-generating enzyme required for sulfatase activity